MDHTRTPNARAHYFTSNPAPGDSAVAAHGNCVSVMRGVRCGDGAAVEAMAVLERFAVPVQRPRMQYLIRPVAPGIDQLPARAHSADDEAAAGNQGKHLRDHETKPAFRPRPYCPTRTATIPRSASRVPQAWPGRLGVWRISLARSSGGGGVARLRVGRWAYKQRMPLHLHRAERADALADGLGRLLGAVPADPFVADVVAVPAKGVERWLAQRLSGVLGVVDGGRGQVGDGIAANIAFPAPTALVAEVLAGASGIAPADDPWAGQRLVCTLLRVIDEVAGQPWAAVLARHLGLPGTDHRVGRRYATAAHLAALFDSYAAQRPQVLLDWTAGADTDGAGGPVPDDLAWQPQLWRALRTAVDAPSPAERLADACARLRAAPDSIDLPERLSLFGLTRLPADQLAVITALAAHRDVHLWMAHPSPVMWTARASLSAVAGVEANNAGTVGSGVRPREHH